MPNLIQDRVRERERWVRGTQTIGGWCRGGGVAGGCHGVDGVEDGGEEVRVGKAWIRRRPWAARVPVPFGPVPALAGNGLGTGEHRGGGEEAMAELPVGLALPEIGSGLWEGFLAPVNLEYRAPAPFRS